jgi:hypothetical protein
LLMLELLWLFYGFGGLHVHSTPCLTSHVAGVASRLTSLVATGAPRGSPLFTPCHTGRCWSGWRCSGWRWTGWGWSGWLCLSLSI